LGRYQARDPMVSTIFRISPLLNSRVTYSVFAIVVHSDPAVRRLPYLSLSCYKIH